MGWDEAGHALRGLVLAQDIQDRAWMALLYDIYRQVYWPPAHTLLLSGAFTAFGATIPVARLTSLVLFLIGSGVIYGCGVSIDRRRGPFVGFVAAVLYLTAPALTPYAGQVMLEIPALVALYVAVWIFFRLDASSRPWHYIWLGFAIVLSYLTKLNYGVLLMIVVGLELLIETRFRPRAIFSQRLLYLSIAVIGPLAVWFAFPPKLWRTWSALVNQPFGSNAVFSTEGLLYYPRALVDLCGSPLLFALFVAALAWAIWRTPHDRMLRVLVLIIAVQSLIGQLHQTKVNRHLFPMLPALYLCTGSLLANMTLGERLHLSHPFWLNRGLAALALVVSGWLFVEGLKPVSAEPRPYVADEVAALVDNEGATLILSTINLVRPSPPQLDWVLSAEYGLLPVSLSDVAMNLEQDLTIANLAAKLPGPAFIRHSLAGAAGRSREPGLVRTLYIDLSDYTEYSQTPDSLHRFLQHMQQDGLFDRALVITPIDPARAFVPIGRSPIPQEFMTEPLERLGYSEQVQHRFEDASVQITVFE